MARDGRLSVRSMKPGEGERERSGAKLDQLDSQLAEVRAQAKRFAADHAATERKLAELGRNFERLNTKLGRNSPRKKA